MKQLGNLAMVCARHPEVLMQIYGGKVFVYTGSGPQREARYALWNDDEKINSIIHELNFGSGGHTILCDGLNKTQGPQERDVVLEYLWNQFGTIPMDPVTECMEAPFLFWPSGTHREEIWKWFDKQHSQGVAHLMFCAAS